MKNDPNGHVQVTQAGNYDFWHITDNRHRLLTVSRPLNDTAPALYLDGVRHMLVPHHDMPDPDDPEAEFTLGQWWYQSLVRVSEELTAETEEKRNIKRAILGVIPRMVREHEAMRRQLAARAPVVTPRPKLDDMSPTQKSFEEAVRPLIRWMAENGHPHTTCIATATGVELVEGVRTFHTEEYLKD